MTIRAPDPADLIDELAYLRKGEGFIARRLDGTSLVRTLLQQNPDDEFGRLRSRFTSAIHALAPADAALLLDVYGLSPEVAGSSTLLQRRTVHAARIGRGIDTVANRERAALQLLALRLTRGSYAQSPLTIDVPDLHGGLIYETTGTLIVVENRHWKLTREHYRFVATFDDMDYLTITRSYPAHASTPPSGHFRVNTRPTSKGFNDHFWSRDTTGHDTPMRRGHTYDLQFTLEPDHTAEQTPLLNAYRALHERSLLASLQVAFIGETPPVLWKQERVSHFAWPGEPHEHNRLHTDERGIASLTLRDVYGGLANGISWQWQ